MPYKTLEVALQEAETIILSARCLKQDPPGHPPDGKPSLKEAKNFECPHCNALVLIHRIREEKGGFKKL